MIRIITGEDKKQIDRYAIETLGVPALALMEEAASQLARAVSEKCLPGSKISAVCGVGNNGGDGIAAARILQGQGYQTQVILTGSEEKATEQVMAQLALAAEAGVQIARNVPAEDAKAVLAGSGLIIDALFGVGLSREVSGVYADWIREINLARVPVYAADIPSGIDATTGAVLGCAVKADVTVTFGDLLKGLVLYPGAGYAGKVKVCDIGFPEEALATVPDIRVTYDRTDTAKLPPRRPYTHKGSYGRVLVIAGSRDISGAAYLAAKAAYRTGAGLVRVLTHEVNRTILGTLVPEALLSVYTGEKGADLRVIREAIDWADVIVAGPGIGRGETGELLTAFAVASGKPAVIDADGIYHLKQMNLGVPKQVILTPHLREMAEFTGKTVFEIHEDLEGTLRGLPENCEGKIVLKDARTFVKDGELVYINTNGNSGMATGGSGDVLAGIIGGLLAQGAEPGEAARLGVFLHGAAGDRAAARLSKYSLMAGDLIEALPEVFLEAEIDDDEE